MSEEWIMAIVCEKMGWPYETYTAQPIYFIKLLLLKWTLEGQHFERKAAAQSKE